MKVFREELRKASEAAEAGRERRWVHVAYDLLTDWFWAAFVDAYDRVVEPNVLGRGLTLTPASIQEAADS